MCLVVAKKWSYNLLLSETHGWSILIEKLDRWRHEHPASITHHHHRIDDGPSSDTGWFHPCMLLTGGGDERSLSTGSAKTKGYVKQMSTVSMSICWLLVSMLLRVKPDWKKNHPNRCTQVEIGKPHPVDWMMVIDAVRSNTYLHIPTGSALYLMMSLS